MGQALRPQEHIFFRGEVTKFPFARRRNFHLRLSGWKPEAQCQVPVSLGNIGPEQ